MKKMIYILVLFTLPFCLSPLLAQDVDVLVIEEAEETTPVTFSGSVDTYFRYNINSSNRIESAPGSSFANLPGFSLGMVNLIAGYEGEDVGFVADLVFGPRGSDAVFASPYYNDEVGTANIINQLYVYWKASDAITLTLGNFNTFLGYEVISPTGNFHYSTSYMFSYGPFSHTGLRADLALSDEFSLMLAIMNPTDLTEFNPVGSYTLGGQLGYSNDAASVYLNLLYGDQDGAFNDNLASLGGETGATLQADITAGFNLSDQFYLGLNATYNTTDPGDFELLTDDNTGFYGAALYLQVSPSETFALGLRSEYFSEFSNFTPDREFVGIGALGAYDSEADGSVIDFTLSGNIKVAQGLTIIPEFRIDLPSEKGSFLDRDLEDINSLSSVLLAAVYAF